MIGYSLKENKDVNASTQMETILYMQGHVSFPKPWIRFFMVITITCLFTGCVSNTPFQVKDIAKTPVDMITDIHLDRITRLLKQLTIKLYKINPFELTKAEESGITRKQRVDQIFSCPATTPFKQLDGKKGAKAMLLGFDETYRGDRIFAVMYGLYTMILASYENQCEFFALDQLDQQKLYNSARNIEILVWRLKTRCKETGKPLLITNETHGEIENLSFERLFGKMIAIQDMMALIVADQSNRIITKVIHTAGMFFLPVGPS